MSQFKIQFPLFKKSFFELDILFINLREKYVRKSLYRTGMEGEMASDAIRNLFLAGT